MRINKQKTIKRTHGVGAVRMSELQGPQAWIDDVGPVGTRSSSGVYTTPESSLKASAVFACVRVLAEDIAKLPIHVYRSVEVGGRVGKERAVDLPIYDLLRYEPNEDMGPFDFEQALVVSAMVYGNGYAEIVRSKGEAGALIPLWSRLVEPDRDESGLYYRYKDPESGERTIRSRDMIHVKGISHNGLLGWMMSTIGRDSFGLFLAAQDFTASYFSNGASTGEAVIYPNAMKPEEFKTWVASMRGQYEGAGRQHRTRYFDRDVKIQAAGGNDPESSQLIETLQFSIEDVARYFRVQPHKIGHLLRATFNNIEHLDLDHYKSTLLPRLVQIEEELTRKLIDRRDRKTLSIKHDPRYVLRADQTTETDTIVKQLNNGLLSRSEGREILDLNPVPGGDKYLLPQNLAIVDDDGVPAPVSGVKAEAAGEAEGLADIESSKLKMMPVFAHATSRVIDREAANVAKLKPAKVRDWYAKHHAYVISEITLACLALGSMVGVSGEDAEAAAARYADSHVAESVRLIESSADGLDSELERWRVERAPWIARHLTDRVCDEQ